MKLLSGNLSPYSAKVRMQIYAMGLEDIQYELPAEFFMGKFSQISPVGRIPVLVTDEGLIPESEVIAEYLDELYPQRAMCGETPFQRAQVRVVSRIADTYLLNNIFMALPQIDRKTRVDAIRDMFAQQIRRGVKALEQHLVSDEFAVGESLTRADCTLVPALFLCERTLPMLDIANPVDDTERVLQYWKSIQSNEYATRVLDEMARGLQERLDGTERKRIEAAIAGRNAQES